MKALWYIFVLITLSSAYNVLLDSATQGPNPQDIATPEPEYIDIIDADVILKTKTAPSMSNKFLRTPNFYNVASNFNNHIMETEAILKHNGYIYKNPIKRFFQYRKL